MRYIRFRYLVPVLLLLDAPSTLHEIGYRVAAAENSTLRAAPAPQEFTLKIDPLIDNVDDLDVRRFTITTRGKRLVKFYIEVGREAKTIRLDKKGDTHMFEAIIVLRFVERPDPNMPARRIRTLSRFLKFDREIGSSIETEIPAAKATTMRDLVKVTAKSGNYLIGKRHLLGHVHGAEILVTVE